MGTCRPGSRIGVPGTGTCRLLRFCVLRVSVSGFSVPGRAGVVPELGRAAAAAQTDCLASASRITFPWPSVAGASSPSSGTVP